MEDDPFAAFKEGNPPEAGRSAKEKKPRQKKATGNGKAKEPPTTATPAAEAKLKQKKPRKPRQAKEMRLPISMLLEIGSLSEEESGALLSIGAGLQKLPKKSRGKITAALSKIFG